MSKLFLKLFLIVFLIVFFIFIIGARTGSEIRTGLEVRLPYSKDYIFSIYSDVYNYPNRKKNLERIEVLERTSSGIIKWIEMYKNGTRLEYEITSRRTAQHLHFEVYNLSTRDASKVKASFQEDSNFTYIYFEEDGYIENKFKRGLRFLLGDDYALRKEAKWLRVAILQEQIERK